MSEPTSHVEQQVAARIAKARADAERKRKQREELTAARAAGLVQRHRRKIQRLIEQGLELAPPSDSTSNTTYAASGV